MMFTACKSSVTSKQCQTRCYSIILNEVCDKGLTGYTTGDKGSWADDDSGSTPLFARLP
jgi:hypothetical protein